MRQAAIAIASLYDDLSAANAACDAILSLSLASRRRYSHSEWHRESRRKPGLDW